MSYGITRRFLLDQRDEQVVLVESPFWEIKRNGRRLRSVLLALTQNNLIIVLKKKMKHIPGICYNKIESQSSLEKIYLSIFKRNHRQIIKVCFPSNIEKYFQLSTQPKGKIFWSIWCNHVTELSREYKVWPFKHSCESLQTDDRILHDEDIINTPQNIPVDRLRWTDKYLYLGSIREAEDHDRPKPVPGLGNTEEVQVLYLKPEYFGCWDQSEHWVQCKESTLATTCDSVVYTYTGEPTSNVTYTSLMTTWK